MAYLSNITTRPLITLLRKSSIDSLLYPPPQPSVLAKSLPVPRGKMPTAGAFGKFNSSNTDSTLLIST